MRRKLQTEWENSRKLNSTNVQRATGETNLTNKLKENQKREYVATTNEETVVMGCLVQKETNVNLTILKHVINYLNMVPTAL